MVSYVESRLTTTISSGTAMEGNKTSVLDKKGSNRTRAPPSSNNRQLETKTHKNQEDRHVGRKSQSKTPASRSRDDGGLSQYMELDDDDHDQDDTRDEGNGGDDFIEANDQATSDGIEDVEDDSVANESETESFVK